MTIEINFTALGKWLVRGLLQNGPTNAVIKDVKWYQSMVKLGEMKITRVGESATIFLQGLEPNFGFEY
jgi:hypothetical protein